MKKFLLSLMLMVVLFPLTMKAQEIVVGEATDNKNVAPFVNSYPHSWCEVVYHVSEIGQACTIENIAFQYVSGEQYTTNEIKIYLAETTKASFDDKSQWTAEDELTLVYTGTNVVLGDEEWETFKLDTPFEYGGEKNLALVVSKTADKAELLLTWSCYDAENSVLFTASDTDAAFAQYPAADGLAIYGKKPIMKLSWSDEPDEPVKPATPTNLRAVVEQDLPDYPNYKYRITVMWDAVEGADCYDVYVNTSSVTDYNMGYTTGTSYIIGTNEETTFEFYVKAVIDEVSSDPSELYTVTVVDDAIEEMTSSFEVCPNPAANEIRISSEERIEEVAIYNINGQKSVANSQQLTSNSCTVNVAELNSGVYFVKVRTDKGEAVKRIIKL